MTASNQTNDMSNSEITPTSPIGLRGASVAELKATEVNQLTSESVNQEKATPSGGIKPVVLIVIDGWGVAPPSQGNAIQRAKMRAWSRMTKDYLYGELIASGESVGLAANEVGSSGVGHLTIGAGRVVQLSVTKINQDIDDGSFMDNPALHVVKNKLNQNNSKLHLMGLIGVGTVHASMKHLWAILDFCQQNEIKEVYLHLFTDGRDSPPTAGKSVLAEIEEKLVKIGVGTIASIGGRYYGMDRDRRWERTQKAYEAIAEGKGHRARSSGEAMNYWYSKQITDEFIEPTVMVRSRTTSNSYASPAVAGSAALFRKAQNEQETGNNEQVGNLSNLRNKEDVKGEGDPLATVEPGDVVFFFNFRADRARQLTQMFCEKKPYRVMSNEQETGNNESTESIKSIKGGQLQATSYKLQATDGLFVSMTNYHEDLRVDLSAYETQPVESPMAEVVAKAGIKQLHIAESEKERFVSYYFNGLRQEKFPGEEVVILPSPKVPTYDKKPEMALPEITQACLKGLRSRTYGFLMMNFANPDMVAHSGNIRATTQACQHVDEALRAISEEVLKLDGILVVTADHGNAEELLTLPRHSFFFTTSSGAMNTDHSNNQVPIVFVGERFKGKGTLPKGGALADVGPTLLSLLGLLPPAVMTGRNLLAHRK